MESDEYVVDEQTDRLGTTSLLANLGVFLVYGAGMIVTGCMIVACKPCAKPGSTLYKIVNTLRKKFFWNGFLRFLI